jgi:hypothetical protein
MGHWSLACVIRPAALARRYVGGINSTCENNINESTNECCLLHMDSLNMHQNHLLNPIYTFLNDQFALQNPGVSPEAKVFNRKNCPIIKPRQVSIYLFL